MPHTEKLDYKFSKKEGIEQLNNAFEKQLGRHDAKASTVETGRGAYYKKGVYEQMNRDYMDTGRVDPRFLGMVNGVRHEN